MTEEKTLYDIFKENKGYITHERGTPISISKRIKDIRIKKGISQKELADLVNMKQSVITTFESKKRINPTIKTLNKFAEALGVTLHDIICESYFAKDFDSKRLYSINNIAVFLDVTYKDVTKLINNNSIPYYKIPFIEPPNDVKIYGQDFIDFLKTIKRSYLKLTYLLESACLSNSCFFAIAAEALLQL